MSHTLPLLELSISRQPLFLWSKETKIILQMFAVAYESCCGSAMISEIKIM